MEYSMVIFANFIQNNIDEHPINLEAIQQTLYSPRKKKDNLDIVENFRNVIVLQLRKVAMQKNKPCPMFDAIQESLDLIMTKLMKQVQRRIEKQKINYLKQYISNTLNTMIEMSNPLSNNITMEHNNEEEPTAPLVHTCGYNSKIIKPVLKAVSLQMGMGETFYDIKTISSTIPETFKATMRLTKYIDPGLRKLEDCIEEEQEEPYKTMRQTAKYTLPQINTFQRNSKAKQPGINLRRSFESKENQVDNLKQKKDARRSQYLPKIRNSQTMYGKTQGRFRSKFGNTKLQNNRVTPTASFLFEKNLA